MYILHEAHYSLLVLRNTGEHLGTILGGHYKQWNQQRAQKLKRKTKTWHHTDHKRTLVYNTVTEPNRLSHQTCNKAHLLTTDCGEGKYSVYFHTAYKESGTANAQKPQFPYGFWEYIFKGRVREGSCRVCSQLVHNSLIGWWWSDSVVLHGFPCFLEEKLWQT